MENPLKRKWAAGQPTLGAWLAVANAYTAELMASLGFDWLTIDLQHGLIDYPQALVMLQAIGQGDTVPLVRVPWNEPGIIGKVLDAGALGVIVPMVSTPEQAAAAVAACRYPPHGQRSYGPTRAALVHGAGYFDAADANVLCVPMIETKEALEQLDAILAVPGVDAVYVGPNDLSLALGLPPGADHDDQVFVDAVERIVVACRRHGVVAGIAGAAATAPKRLAQGFLLVEVSRDAGAMVRQARADLKSVRSSVRA